MWIFGCHLPYRNPSRISLTGSSTAAEGLGGNPSPFGPSPAIHFKDGSWDKPLMFGLLPKDLALPIPTPDPEPQSNDDGQSDGACHSTADNRTGMVVTR